MLASFLPLGYTYLCQLELAGKLEVALISDHVRQVKPQMTSLTPVIHVRLVKSAASHLIEEWSVMKVFTQILLDCSLVKNAQ